MILQDISDVIDEALKSRTCKEVSELFGRERKWSMMRKIASDGIRLDTKFLCGLDTLGYEIVLQKKGARNMSEKRLLTCQNCGGEFVARTKHAMYCVDCRPIMQRKRADKKRSEEKQTVKPLYEAKSINAVLRELDTYNRKHGTHLTYGQYEALKRVGRV